MLTGSGRKILDSSRASLHSCTSRAAHLPTNVTQWWGRSSTTMGRKRGQRFWTIQLPLQESCSYRGIRHAIDGGHEGVELRFKATHYSNAIRFCLQQAPGEQMSWRRAHWNFDSLEWSQRDSAYSKELLEDFYQVVYLPYVSHYAYLASRIWLPLADISGSLERYHAYSDKQMGVLRVLWQS
jgi:hypothetical protein